MPMSNIGTLRLTDARAARDFRDIAAQASVWIASAILTIGIISFRPFQPAGAIGDAASREGGDIVNQLGFGLLGVAAVFGLICLAQPRKLAALFSPWWILMLGLMFLSTQIAAEPAIVVRAYLLTVIGMVAVASVILLPRDGDGYARVLATMSIAVLGICYLGVIFYSSVAVHGYDAYEPQHAGFWRGSFSHKNVAGPVMAFISYIGFYLLRRGWRWIGALIFIGGLFFLLQTGSKTSAGLVAAGILAVALPSILGLRWLTVLFFCLALIVTAIGTLGVEFIPPLKAYVTENMTDFTYTGRTSLWRFAWDMITLKPWTGYGFESFWLSPTVRDTYPPFDREWDIRGIVNGHDGYLDVAVTMGIPAMVVAIIALIIVPMIDYLRTPLKRENIYLSDLFMMILFFGSLNAFLETFLFKRIEPVWLLYFLAAFGMRYVARFPLKFRANG